MSLEANDLPFRPISLLDKSDRSFPVSLATLPPPVMDDGGCFRPCSNRRRKLPGPFGPWPLAAARSVQLSERIPVLTHHLSESLVNEGILDPDSIDPLYHAGEQPLILLGTADRVDLLRRAPYQKEAAEVSDSAFNFAQSVSKSRPRRVKPEVTPRSWLAFLINRTCVDAPNRHPRCLRSVGL